MAVENVMNHQFNMRLGTISQTNHWIVDNFVCAYEPYIREMRIWADLFREVEIFTPLTTMPQYGNLATYERANITFRFVRYNTRVFTFGFLVRMFQFPVVFFQMLRFIRRHDLFLIRAPGHFSLMAHILVVLMRKKSITKFAGFFGSFVGERWPSRVERFFMRTFLQPRNVVLVYGKPKKDNFISFIPLLMSRAEMDEIHHFDHVQRNSVFSFCSLGRLLKAKGFDLAIRGLGELYRLHPEWKWQYFLIGDGPEGDHLCRLAQEAGIADRVVFLGRKNYREAMRYLKQCDVLIMPGEKEGWPKSVAEAWIAGVVPVCTRAGLLPDIIDHGKNGFLFNPDPRQLAKVCEQVYLLPDAVRKEMILKNKQHAAGLTAEVFREGVAAIVRERLQTGTG